MSEAPSNQIGTTAPSSSSSRQRRSFGPVKTCIALAVLAAVVLLLLTAGWCAAFLPQGTLPATIAYHLSLTSNFLIACLAYASIPVAAVALLAWVVLRFARAKTASHWAIGIACFFVPMLPMTFAAHAIYWPTHHKAVWAVPPRAQALVAAIEIYRQDHDAPPPTLYALVPDRISAIPGTGLSGFPKFKYRLLADSPARPRNFELYMPCPWSYAGPSALVYWPKDNGYLASWPQDAAWRWDDGDWVYVNMR